MYKMAVLDIDGTIVDDKGRLSRRTIEVINKVRRSGALVTICTGRNLRNTLPIIAKTKIDVPVSCIDGTFIFDPKTGRISDDLTMGRERAEAVLNTAGELDLYTELSDGKRYYKYISSADKLRYDIYNKHTVPGRIKSHIKGVRYTRNIDSLYRLTGGTVYQIAVAGVSEELSIFRKRLDELAVPDIEIRDYLLEGYLYINRTGIRKERGLELLCRKLGIHVNETVAIGDEMNDLDMIRAAGLGVAMGNAVEQVKLASGYVTLTNNEDGAAAALEKIFLN